MIVEHQKAWKMLRNFQIYSKYYLKGIPVVGLKKIWRNWLEGTSFVFSDGWKRYSLSKTERMSEYLVLFCFQVRDELSNRSPVQTWIDDSELNTPEKWTCRSEFAPFAELKSRLVATKGS